MTPIIIYGPKGSGKTYNAKAFMRYYGKSSLLDVGQRFQRIPKTLDVNALVLTTQGPKPGEPRTWIHVDDAMRAIGKNPFRLSSSNRLLASRSSHAAIESAS